MTTKLAFPKIPYKHPMPGKGSVHKRVHPTGQGQARHPSSCVPLVLSPTENWEANIRKTQSDKLVYTFP